MKKYIYGIVALVIIVGIVANSNIQSSTYLTNLHGPNQIEIDNEALGAGAAVRPTGYKAFLDESKSAAHSDTTLTVSTITLRDGTTLDGANLGSTIVLSINPGKSNNEIVKCTGLTTASKQFTGCTFGYKLDGTNTTQNANILAHSPGEPVIISNDDLYLNQVYPQKNATSTITGQWNFSSSTVNVVKLEFGTSTNAYIWFDKSSGQIGFASSTSGELVWNTDGTTFSPLNPIQLNSGILILATSSASGLILNGGALEINDGYGLALGGDGKLNVATSSSVNWSFGGFATTSKTLVIGTSNPIGDFGVGDLWVGGNATTSDSLHVAEICDPNNYCRTNLRQLASSTTDAITISNSDAVTGIMNTTTITGGLLGDTNVIRVRVNLADTRTTGSVNATVILRYGGQELATFVSGATLGIVYGSIEAIIMADGATNAQIAFLKVDLPEAGGGDGLVGYATTTLAGTVDSTMDQDLTITWQWAVANSLNRVVASSTFVEIIQ